MRLEQIELAELYNKDNLMQSRFWGRAKRETGKTPLTFRLGSDHFGPGAPEVFLLVLITPLAGSCYAYLPLGPDIWVLPEERGRFLEALSENLARFLPRECIFIRYDLPWETPYAAGDDGEYDTADGRPSQQLRELRMNFGTRSRNLRKASTDVQPSDTLLLDIDRPDETLLAGMKAKTRYNVRLAGRRGIEVRDANPDGLEAWYRLYRETAARKGIVLEEQEYFSSLFQTFRQHRTPNLELHLLLAEKGYKALAGIILVLHGATATYLYGASGNEGRELMPSHRLQWEAIRFSRACSCRMYDFFGIPPTAQPSHPMHGLYRFKTGFGGNRLHRQGCWDFPLRQEEYLRFSAMERSCGGYHL